MDEVCKTLRQNKDHDIPVVMKDIVFGRLHWCPIPKVGTTYISYSLNDQLDKWGKQHPHQLDIQPSKFRKSFVFVREPYSRLISGYLDKILTTPKWWPKKGHAVMVGAGVLDATSKWTEKCALYATFTDFIRYFINSEITRKGRNPHYVPIHEQCDICTSNYTFIGHLETFGDDLKYILSSVNVTISELVPPAVHEESIIRRKSAKCFKEGISFVKQCSDKFTMMQKLWFNFQVRGFISESSELPVSRNQSQDMSAETFGNLVLNTRLSDKGRFDPRKQRESMQAQMYRDVPLELRLMLKQILENDFLLSEYDPNPEGVFPELKE